jgi:hypothetical protein
LPFSSQIKVLRVKAPEPWFGNPASDAFDVVLELEDGRAYTIPVATPDRIEIASSEPVIIVRSADQETVAEALSAMAAELSGYWLRRYNRVSRRQKGASVAIKASELVADAENSESGVLEIQLGDSRRFSVLAATSAWFARRFGERGLRFYFGPPILFLPAFDSAAAQKAVADKLEPFFCLYDTPHATPEKVLSEFGSRQS